MKIIQNLLVILLVLSGVEALADSDLEATKMAYLVRLTDFVHWPGEQREVLGKRQHARVNICVFGKDPFRGRLAAIIREQQTKTRFRNRLSLKYPNDMNSVKSQCKIVFISTSEKQQASQALNVLENLPILTISDIPNFLEIGGMIRMYANQNGGISFEVSLDTTRAARLKISSKFLRLSIVQTY